MVSEYHHAMLKNKNIRTVVTNFHDVLTQKNLDSLAMTYGQCAQYHPECVSFWRNAKGMYLIA